MIYKGEINLKPKECVKILEDVEIKNGSISLCCNSFLAAFARISYVGTTETDRVQSSVEPHNFTRFNGYYKVKSIEIFTPDDAKSVWWEVITKGDDGDGYYPW